MSNLTKNLDETFKDNYYTYGKYINFNRVVPAIDGLKPVHRRALLGTRDVARHKLVSAVNVVGAIQVRHPFGQISIESSLADMVRLGCLTGKGSWGIKLMEDVPAAATRYVQCGINEAQDNYFFKLLKYAPEHEGEVDIEPEYLITPVPYCLIYGALNWGLGIAGRTPAFTFDSLIKAYEANDPTLLESNFGYILNKKTSELHSLWEKGTGALDLSFRLDRKGDDIYIRGSGELFKPAIGLLKKYQELGQILVSIEDSTEICIHISRAYRSRVNMDEVYETCKSIIRKTKRYNILVVKDGAIRTIGIREWLETTIGRYIETYEKYKQERVDQLERSNKVLSHIPEVSKMLMDNKSDKDIVAAISKKDKEFNLEILDSIKSKPIRILRKDSFDAEIKANKDKIKAIQKESAEAESKRYFV